MQNKEYLFAVAALERVAQQSPHHAGALLDLVESHYHLQDREEVAVLLTKLESGYDLPESVQLLVARYREWLAQTLPVRIEDAQNSAKIEIERGYSSNVNGGSSHHTINLIGLELALSDASLPKSDSFTSSTLQLSQQRRLEGWQLNGLLVTQALKYDTHHQYNNEWALVGLTAQRPIAEKHQLIFSGYNLWLNSQNSTDQENIWLQAKISQAVSRHKSVGYWVNGQNVKAENHQEDSRQYKIGVGFNQIIGPNYLNTALEIGRDEAVGERKGGRRHLAKVKATLLSGLGDFETKLQLQYRIEQDRQAYDQALFGQKRRNRKQLRLEASGGYKINGKQKIIIWTDYIKERSEIKLFESRGWRAGLRWQFGW